LVSSQELSNCRLRRSSSIISDLLARTNTNWYRLDGLISFSLTRTSNLAGEHSLLPHHLKPTGIPQAIAVRRATLGRSNVSCLVQLGAKYLQKIAIQEEFFW
jgi:hypothetical protein